MTMLIFDNKVASQPPAEQLADGLDQHDEVWDGETIIMPLPNDEHQAIIDRLSALMVMIFGWSHPHHIRPGVNISDRPFDWKQNYRCPDFVVFLEGNPAINRGSYWQGGPDFLVEIVSEDDRSREKLPFYASVQTREVLVVDRNPWVLELYQCQRDELILVGESRLELPKVLTSSVLPVAFQLIPGDQRPGIEVTHTTTGQQWVV